MGYCKNSSELIAHRGFSEVAPENTVAAMMRAMELGAGVAGCEMDVYRCKSGEIVVIHDDNVERVSGGIVTGDIREMSLDEIKSLDVGSWKGQEYAGERIPTLNEVLKVLKDGGCSAVVEIKMKGITREVLDVVRAEGMINFTSIISFHEEVVKEVRQMSPNLPCAWLISEELEGTAMERAQQIIDRTLACNANMVDLDHGMLSDELMVDQMHRSGLTIWVWTVDEADRMAEMIRWGVDAVTTNRPDEFLRVREKCAD